MSFRHDALKLVVDNNYKTVIEVGVWEGRLSKMLYEVVDTLILVDPWLTSWNEFEYQVVDGDMYRCGMGEPLKTQSELGKMYANICKEMPRARVFRLPSLEAVCLIPNESVDLVFIDAIHTYEHCKDDIEAWLPKIKLGGMIAGDDYIPEHNTVSKAVDELFGNQKYNRVWSVRV